MLINTKKIRLNCKRDTAERLIEHIDALVMGNPLENRYSELVLFASLAEVSHQLEGKLIPGVKEIKFGVSHAQLAALGVWQERYASSPTHYDGTVVRRWLMSNSRR